jgi:hypothetical protein
MSGKAGDKAPMALLEEAEIDRDAARALVSAIYEGEGQNPPGFVECVPGRHLIAIFPQDRGRGIRIVRRNEGNGAPSIDINNREEALWLARELRRIYG